MYAPLYLQRYCHLVRAVVGARDGDRVNFSFEGGAFGGIVGNDFDNKHTSVENSHSTVSLNTILRTFGAPHTIDYLSLDVEGAEWHIMETFDWDSHVFLVLTIERPKQELVRELTLHGYSFLCLNGWFGDELWIHSSLPNADAVRASHFNGTRGSCPGTIVAPPS